MDIAENIARVRNLIAEAADAVGRNAKEITLVGASKTMPAGAVREAIRAGIDAVGENRVQEMLAKWNQDAYAGAPLHFIGHLQRNKVHQVVGRVGLVESVDSYELLTEIDKCARKLGIRQDVLIEVNIGEEASKSGIAPQELNDLTDKSAGLGNVCIRGLMAIPPALEKADGNRYFFEAMYQLFVDTSSKTYDNVNMKYLSMGMSGDYKEAIAAGSNMVRIGSAIFGERNRINL